MITLALIPVLSLPPSISLAQVASAFDARTQYTIVNTRLMNKGVESIKWTSYRSGHLWRQGSRYGLPDKTVSVFYLRGLQKFVEIDEPQPPVEQEFRVDRLLRPSVKPKIERNVLWRGRRVHRFVIRDNYMNTDKQTFDQEVIVDPKTSLPIQMTIMRDSRQWGDVWDYSFGTPPASVFVPNIPKDAKVFDSRKLRKELPALLGKGPVGAFLLDESRRLVALVDPQAAPQGIESTLRVAGAEGSLSGQMVLDLAPWSRPSGRKGADGLFTIGGRKWRVYHFFLPVPYWPRVDGLRKRTTTTGKLTIGEKTLAVKDVPVRQVGNAINLLSAFSD
jgi:hypothetical protein